MLLTLGLTTKATAQTANEVYLDDREVPQLELL